MPRDILSPPTAEATGQLGCIGRGRHRQEWYLSQTIPMAKLRLWRNSGSLVAPASCRRSLGHLALSGRHDTRRTAAETAALQSAASTLRSGGVKG